ncbi:hypothetical protein D3C80_670700 [compost metagenome]
MSRLIFRAWHNPETGTTFGKDDVLATFIGTPAQTLGQAVMFFNERAKTHHERIVSGDLPDAPEVIMTLAKEFLAKPLEERNSYTIKQFADGFKIWISDGPDVFELVN